MTEILNPRATSERVSDSQETVVISKGTDYIMCVHKLKLFLVFLSLFRMIIYKLEMYVACQFVNCKCAMRSPVECLFIVIVLASCMVVRLQGLKNIIDNNCLLLNFIIIIIIIIIIMAFVIYSLPIPRFDQ